MSEKKFQKIVSACVAIVLAEAFLFNYVNQVLQAIFGIIAFACVGILIYTGLKEERPEPRTEHTKDLSFVELNELEFMKSRYAEMLEKYEQKSAELSAAKEEIDRLTRQNP